MEQASDRLPQRVPGITPHPGLTAEEASLLRELQSIWHDKYVIKAGDVWTAQRIGSTSVITSDTGFELRGLITQDAISWNRERFLQR